MKHFFRFLLGLIVVLLIVVIINTMKSKSLQVAAEPIALSTFGKESAANLSKAITFPTISYDINLPIDTAAFIGYHKFLVESYPLISLKLKKEIISNFSLLYTWEGSNKALKPVILMAHMDVVPAGEINSWEKKPFSGENDGTFIWGRGTLDDKAAMISIHEAIERLLSENYQPERTIYLAFGHDEELIGERGAKVIASVLKQRGVEAEFILDEGLAITVGMVPMIKKPVALIGTSEKGFLSVKLSVEMHGGHASTPEKESAIILLNRAIYKMVNNPMKAHITSPVNDFFRYVGPEMPFYAKAIFANRWLFKSVILNIYEGKSTSNAQVRTTSAPTILIAGVKDNVVPTKAEAIVNFRILPEETSTDVLHYLTEIIDDKRVVLTPIKESLNEPSPVSPTNVYGFELILKTMHQVYPEAIVAPTMMLGSSDSKYFSEVSKNIYKFAPIVVNSEDMARIHGLNERNRIDDFTHGISFYYQLIKNIK
jgi:carboxypeptidase PM20D1